MMLIFAVFTDGTCTYLTKAPKDFDILTWGNNPKRIAAFKLLGIASIHYEIV